jgi:hypothetical protein
MLSAAIVISHSRARHDRGAAVRRHRRIVRRIRTNDRDLARAGVIELHRHRLLTAVVDRLAQDTHKRHCSEPWNDITRLEDHVCFRVRAREYALLS